MTITETDQAADLAAMLSGKEYGFAVTWHRNDGVYYVSLESRKLEMPGILLAADGDKVKALETAKEVLRRAHESAQTLIDRAMTQVTYDLHQR